MPGSVREAVQGEQVSAYNQECPEVLNIVLLKLFKDNIPTHIVNEPMLIATVQQIKNKYWYFRLQEIAMVLQKGSMGFYGNIPQGANPVLYWFSQYDTGERLDYFESENTKHKEPYEKQQQENERKEVKKMTDLAKQAYQRIRSNEQAKRKLESHEHHKTNERLAEAAQESQTPVDPPAH